MGGVEGGAAHRKWIGLVGLFPLEREGRERQRNKAFPYTEEANTCKYSGAADGDTYFPLLTEILYIMAQAFAIFFDFSLH